MARDLFKKELFISSCLNPPNWLDDMVRRVQEEQERELMREMFGVPQYKISTDYYGFTNPQVVYKTISDEEIKKMFEKENNKMEAKKCDRCGKLYEKKFDKNDIRCIFKHEEPFFEREEKNYSKEFIDEKKTHDVFIKRGNGDYIDMCPDCRKAFQKWFEES